MTEDTYDTTAVVHGLRDLWTNHDESDVPRLFTEDALYRDVAWDYRFVGHAAIRDYHERVLIGIPDFTETIDSIIDVRPGTIVSNFHYSGTYSDDRITKRFSLPCTRIITMRGAKVESSIDYYGGDDFLAALDWVYPTREALRDREVAVSMAQYAGGDTSA